MLDPGHDLMWSSSNHSQISIVEACRRDARRLCSAVGRVGAAWEAPGVRAPHDMAVVASPVRLAGKERPLALLIAETAEAGSSRLHKFILLPEGEHSHQHTSLLAGPSQCIDAERSSGVVVTCLTGIKAVIYSS